MFEWNKLRRVGNTLWAKQSILAPAVGYLILFNNQILSILGVDASNEGTTIITWTRLHLTYFGLSFFGFASATFHIFCPEIVKRFGEVEEYLQQELNLHTNDSLVLVYDSCVSRFGDPFSSRLAEALARLKPNRTNPLSPANLSGTLQDNQARINLLRIHYDFCNGSRRPVAVSVGSLYFIAGILLAVPFVLLFIDVIETLIR